MSCGRSKQKNVSSRTLQTSVRDKNMLKRYSSITEKTYERELNQKRELKKREMFTQKYSHRS